MAAEVLCSTAFIAYIKEHCSSSELKALRLVNKKCELECNRAIESLKLARLEQDLVSDLSNITKRGLNIKSLDLSALSQVCICAFFCSFVAKQSINLQTLQT